MSAITLISALTRGVSIDAATDSTVTISQRSGFSGRVLTHDIDPVTGDCVTIGCDYDPLDDIVSRIDDWASHIDAPMYWR